MGMGLEASIKASTSKALVIKINIVFVALFLFVYASLLVQPLGSLYPPYLDKNEGGGKGRRWKNVSIILEKVKNKRVGLVGIEPEEVGIHLFHSTTTVRFDEASEGFQWKDLFPEWIDEEEENEGPSCPTLPMPDFSLYGEIDVVVAKLPCRSPEPGWRRDVRRLQSHLVSANLAVKKAERDRRGRLRLVFWSKCPPMMEIFRCRDLVRREGEWWEYEVDAAQLEEKTSMAVGSCNLALPLWQQGRNEEYDLSRLRSPAIMGWRRREAYVTVLHSSDMYVCGAVALAQSIKMTGSTRDLILLHDKSITGRNLQALVAAGWKLRLIKRIRNPHGVKGSYNEYNYSKLRIWQLVEYDKVVFIDADVMVLKNMDLLFGFPEMSAVGNDGWMFNSGVMVVEPSADTFSALMRQRKAVVSGNGGDQGFLNEVFVWWHRLPRRVNFLKNFWANTTAEAAVKDRLFRADNPPRLYAIHYLGIKPWLCYRDYDCNWNIPDQRVFASDAAHRRWWRMHDQMDKGLRAFCSLSDRRRMALDWERNAARKAGLPDGHWKLNITDNRRRQTRVRG